MMIKASVDPDCGSAQAAKMAAQTAAVETIRAGFDRYIVIGAQSANNVQYVQQPGTYETTKTVKPDGFGTKVTKTSTYVPGATLSLGSYDQDLTIQMFHDGEPGSENALSAREVLGPDWQRTVANGVSTVCF
ncbi:hypothetical protein [Pseudoxanthobacter sp.]|uniref:hypothetical protein n=1 Tax=Pseudoxanthobacter sp. TaxID=1925742 RepID=UPI002FE2D70F